MPMTASRPYLLRALNEWILGNQCTPYIVVDATAEGVNVPEQHIKNGQIVLNINPAAVRHLDISNQAVGFEARFGGQPQSVYVPIEAVMAVYAKENGQGMVFGWETEPSGPNSPSTNDGSVIRGGIGKATRPSLKVVK